MILQSDLLTLNCVLVSFSDNFYIYICFRGGKIDLKGGGVDYKNAQ